MENFNTFLSNGLYLLHIKYAKPYSSFYWRHKIYSTLPLRVHAIPCFQAVLFMLFYCSIFLLVWLCGGGALDRTHRFPFV